MEGESPTRDRSISRGTSPHCRKVQTAQTDQSFYEEPHKVRWRSLIMSNQDILRSTPDSTILRSFGRVFRDFPEGYDTFKLSETTHKLHVFISHNWATPRRIKFMALAFHFNHATASIAAAIAYVATVLIVMAATSHMDADMNDIFFLCHLGTAVCLATYWLFLLFWHDVKWLLRCRGKRVFLDRCCIHQTDEDLKQQGIEHLDIFLQLSDRMLVVYSELYTKKLWTMYELATFLPKRGPKRLVVLLTFLIRCTILAVPMLVLHCVWVQLLLFDSVREQSRRLLPDWRLAIGILDFPLLLSVTWAFRSWAKEEQQMLKNIKTFHYGDANCLQETDRLMVCSNIARYMRDTRAVRREATDEQALLAFNELVKTEVPLAVTQSLGAWGIPVRYLCVILLPLMTNMLDYLAVAPLLYSEPRAMAAFAAGLVSFALSSLLCATFLVWLTKRCLDASGWRQCLLIFTFSILQLAPAMAVFSLVELLQALQARNEGHWPLVGLVALPLGQLVLLALAHCGRRGDEEQLLKSNKRALYSYRVRFAKHLTMSVSPKSSPKRRGHEPESERVVQINSVASIYTSEASKATSCIVEARM